MNVMDLPDRPRFGCHDPNCKAHATLAELERVKTLLANLLRNVGDSAVCSGPTCGADIVWIRHRNGARMPYDRDGVPHWATCPDRASFKAGKQHG